MARIVRRKRSPEIRRSDVLVAPLRQRRLQHVEAGIVNEVRIEWRAAGIAKRGEELSNVLAYPGRLWHARAISRLLSHGAGHERPRDFAGRGDGAPGNDQRCPPPGPPPGWQASEHTPNARLEEGPRLAERGDAEHARVAPAADVEQQVAGRGGRAAPRQK